MRFRYKRFNRCYLGKTINNTLEEKDGIMIMNVERKKVRIHNKLTDQEVYIIKPPENNIIKIIKV